MAGKFAALTHVEHKNRCRQINVVLEGLTNPDFRRSFVSTARTAGVSAMFSICRPVWP